MSKRTSRVVIVATWAMIVVVWFVYQRSTGLGPVAALQAFVDAARGAWWALIAFIAFYAARPLILFPASLLTVAGGVLFGPVVGIAATIVGANTSAMVAYWLARSLRFEVGDCNGGDTLAQRWAGRLRNESFTTIMAMRLLYLPYDLVNYAAGVLRIRPLSFLLATAIGSIPGTVSFTLAGASIERIEDGPSGINPRILTASVVLFAASVGIAQYLKSRQDRNALV